MPATVPYVFFPPALEQWQVNADFDAVLSAINNLVPGVVSTIADLRASTVPTAFTVLVLGGYYIAGDKPAVIYGWNGTDTRADDGGSVILPTGYVGVGRWNLLATTVSILDFGANTGLSDNSTMLQAAVNAAQTSYGTLTVPLGTFQFKTRLDVSAAFNLASTGGPFADSTAGPAPVPGGGSVLQWTGAANATMLRIQAVTSAHNLYGGSIRGVTFDGNALAGFGVIAASVQHWDFDFSALKCTTAGFQIDDGNNQISAGCTIDFAYRAGTDMACANSVGLILDGTQNSKGVTLSRIGTLLTNTANAPGLWLKDVDACIVEFMQGFAFSGPAIQFSNTARNNRVLCAPGIEVTFDSGTYGNELFIQEVLGTVIVDNSGGKNMVWSSDTTSPGVLTYAGLPRAIAGVAFAGLTGSPALGMMAVVTNSTTNTFGAIVAGGGGNTVLCWYNGSNWTVIGV